MIPSKNTLVHLGLLVLILIVWYLDASYRHNDMVKWKAQLQMNEAQQEINQLVLKHLAEQLPP